MIYPLQFAGKTCAIKVAKTVAPRSSFLGPRNAPKMLSTLRPLESRSLHPLLSYVGLASIAAVVSITGTERTKCDAIHRRRATIYQGQVISLQELDLNQLSNETAQRLIDALNNGAQIDKESIVKLMTMRRRLSPSTARTLIAALDNGASLDKDSVIKLIRLQLTSGPLSSRS